MQVDGCKYKLMERAKRTLFFNPNVLSSITCCFFFCSAFLETSGCFFFLAMISRLIAMGGNEVLSESLMIYVAFLCLKKQEISVD